MANIRVEYPEGAGNGASQVSKGIKIEIDDNEVKTTLVLGDNLASEVADNILRALGELTSEELKDKILDLVSENEGLREQIEQYEENNDAYRDKLMESCYPL